MVLGQFISQRPASICHMAEWPHSAVASNCICGVPTAAWKELSVKMLRLLVVSCLLLENLSWGLTGK